jgi:hypothetical protein
MTRVMYADDTAIKLHTAASGVVWFADGDRVPISSGVQADEFVMSLQGRDRPHVRLIGNHANASLIMRLRALITDADGRLEVASPLLCDTVAERADPDVALFRLRQCNMPASLGGWHEVTDADYCTYSLVAQLHSDMDFLPTSRHLLYRHPAWRYLTFVDSLSEEWAAWLISTVIDPRWYVDPEKPSRLSRVKSFLGLDPATMRSVVADPNRTPMSPREIKCRMVHCAWASSGPPDAYALSAPSNFVWRVYFDKGADATGSLRASQKFVEYMVFTWMQAIRSSDPRYSGAQPLFLPELLFKGEEEVRAYLAHVV